MSYSLRTFFEEPDRKYLSDSDFEGVTKCKGLNCPHCNAEVEVDHDSDSLKGTTRPRYEIAVAMEYGGTPERWNELWECNSCHKLYSVSNSNY